MITGSKNIKFSGVAAFKVWKSKRWNDKQKDKNAEHAAREWLCSYKLHELYVSNKYFLKAKPHVLSETPGGIVYVSVSTLKYLNFLIYK